jgi:hypothetical protein
MPDQFITALARPQSRPKSKRRQPIGVAPPPADQSDWVWGGEAIAEELGCTPEQLYYLFSTGIFGDAVFKLGRKTMVASRSRLRELPTLLSRKP